MTNVYIKVLESGRVPEYQSLNAAGCDVYAAKDIVLLPGQTKVVPLNFIIAMEKDVEAQVRPRSGLSLKTDIRLANCVGTIDSDYRDIVGVIVQNTYNPAVLAYRIMNDSSLLKDLSENYTKMTIGEYLEKNIECEKDKLPCMNDVCYIDKRGNPYGSIYIKKGERIAQIIFAKVERANFIMHDDPTKVGHNRGGGFGHTGQ
ncbi:MAG: aminotransferase [Clostridiales bacterium]|nr:aminotransferase [Clostridiales bacterium]